MVDVVTFIKTEDAFFWEIAVVIVEVPNFMFVFGTQPRVEF